MNRSTSLAMPDASPKNVLRCIPPRSAPRASKPSFSAARSLACRFTNPSAIPIELDRVLGMEANFAGMSFLTTEKLRKLKYGSDIVNVVADARLEHGPGLGTFAYDDEGVPAQCTPIITNGLFTGYLSSRETAASIGEKRSGGTVRCESWNRLPMIRMTNISINPGTWKYEDLIADTDDAILMETNRSWSIDDKPLPFPVFDRNRLGNQGRQEGPHDQESQLQRNHHGVLEQLRRHLLARLLDTVGHAQLRQGPAQAGDGHGTRRVPGALPQYQSRRRLREIINDHGQQERTTIVRRNSSASPRKSSSSAKRTRPKWT